MNQELQQSKLRLSISSNLFENVNKSRIKKVREQKRQLLCNLELKNNANIIQQDTKQLDAKRVRIADKLFDKYFSKNNKLLYDTVHKF